MAIIKATPQFSIWCDGDGCKNLEDFSEFSTRSLAKKYFRSLGWVIGKKVKCPECAAPNKARTGLASQLAPANESETFNVLAHYQSSQSASQ